MTRFLPEQVYSADQTRKLDRLSMDEFGLGGGVLMDRAGEAAYAALCRAWPQAKRIVIVCGPGNNGGDGYVLGRLALVDGLEVVLLSIGDLLKQGEDAQASRRAFENAGGVISPFAPEILHKADVIVDGVFGTGLERQVTGEWAATIDAINAAGAPVLALDIPSGLHADTGVVLGTAVRATETISFIGLKAGLLTADGPDCCGRLRFNSLAVPDEVYQRVSVFAERISAQSLFNLFPKRLLNSHKGNNGRVLVVGGGPSMPGAARLTGEAALYTGAGLVTVATHPHHVNVINSNRPELIVKGINEGRELAPLLSQADVIAVGPGLGQSSWAHSVLCAILDSSLPKVIDADALNLIAMDPCRDENWILTPHPGEAATLLGEDSHEIQQGRFSSAKEIVDRFGGICVLKGAGTIISAADHLYICNHGNPSLATAGTGDLLTGVIASLVAQGCSNLDSSRAGVWIHAMAADLIAKNGERGWLASDLLPYMRKVIHDLEEEEQVG